MSKLFYHEACARECGCLGDSNVAIIDPQNMDCDIDGWDYVCEACCEPSEAAQAYDAREYAHYASLYDNPYMREHLRVEHELRNASDAELEQMSRDCGRRLSRPI